MDTGFRYRPAQTSFVLEFDRRLADVLRADAPGKLMEAVTYAALAPGKRLRPYLVVRSCEICGGKRDDAWATAAAVECVHAFSLVHDDLPAMDNDDLRRGQPTCHKKFGEALAILAGDALVVLAFELLSTKVAEPATAVVLCRELAAATGWSGMIGGQASDILGEAEPPDRTMTESIHGRKTAALFRAACRMGAMVGHGNADQVDRLGRFGEKLGRAFQIADDLLDVAAHADDAGTKSGKNTESCKQTFPRCVGISESRAAAGRLVAEAAAELAAFDDSATDLKELCEFVIELGF